MSEVRYQHILDSKTASKTFMRCRADTMLDCNAAICKKMSEPMWKLWRECRYADGDFDSPSIKHSVRLMVDEAML